jgi:hypothetical protein
MMITMLKAGVVPLHQFLEFSFYNFSSDGFHLIENKEKSLQKHCESERLKLRPCIRMYRGKEEQNRYLEHFPYVDILFWLFGGEIRRATYTCGPYKSTSICPVSSTAAAKATINTLERAI